MESMCLEVIDSDGYPASRRSELPACCKAAAVTTSPGSRNLYAMSVRITVEVPVPTSRHPNTT